MKKRAVTPAIGAMGESMNESGPCKIVPPINAKTKPKESAPFIFPSHKRSAFLMTALSACRDEIHCSVVDPDFSSGDSDLQPTNLPVLRGKDNITQ